MSSVYPRGRVLWVAYVDAGGKRRCMSSDYRLGGSPAENERALLQAREFLREVERRVALLRAAAETGPLTLARYAPGWIERRRRRGVLSADQNASELRDHVLPVLGTRPLVAVRPPEIRQLFRDLADGGRLAPKSVHSVYGTLHCLFADAVAEELRDANPCVLSVRRGELPEKVDKDPTWRGRAIYAAAEARRLCLDESIAPWRRALYAALFFAGVRIGELVMRRWADYEPELEPLGRLSVPSAWSSRAHAETGTKSRRPRDVPVHPQLAGVLARWRLEGWPTFMGRMPEPEDLLFPIRGALDVRRPRSSKSVLKALKRDLRRLGLRSRRTHDTRRTFVSLARAGGAQDAMLRWITHGPGKRTILDVYTTPAWGALCNQVLAVGLDLRPAEAVPLPPISRREA